MTKDLTNYTNAIRVSKTLHIQPDHQARRLRIEMDPEGSGPLIQWLDYESTLAFREALDDIISEWENPQDASE